MDVRRNGGNGKMMQKFLYDWRWLLLECAIALCVGYVAGLIHVWWSDRPKKLVPLEGEEFYKNAAKYFPSFQERFPCAGCGSTKWRYTVRVGVGRVLNCSECEK